MIWLSNCIDGKEGNSLSSSNVVRPRDVDGEVDDVVYVDIVHPAGVDGDVCVCELDLQSGWAALITWCQPQG